MALPIDAAVIDTSVLVAIFEQEPDASIYASWLAKIPDLCMSSMSVYETSIVLLMRRGRSAVTVLYEFLYQHKVAEISFSQKHAAMALDAYSVYGKGIHAKARLNFGDCAAYALAKNRTIPLLYKGDDFSHTDLAYVWSS